MNLNLLSEEVQDFIKTHAQARGSDLILQGINLPHVSGTEVVGQLESRQKLAPKAPVFTTTTNIYFPPKLSAEQASSQLLAEFKASLVQGSSFIDVTGGMGIDTYYLSQQLPQAQYCELNEQLATITAHNFKQLGADHVQVHIGDGIEFLKTLSAAVDVVYIDPARRGGQGQKVFLLEHCTPNIIQHWNLLLEKGTVVMVKLSPMIDITYLTQALSHVIDICVVAEKNEVKEVLVFASKKAHIKSINVHATVLQANNQPKSFTYAFKDPSPDIHVNQLPPDRPLYIYEPAGALLKSGGHDRYAQNFGLTKLHQNAHLYWSNKLVPEFMGRTYELLQELKVDKKALAKVLPGKKANIVCRNFPLKPADVAKKLKINEGGDLFLICTTIEGLGKRLLLGRVCI